MENSELCPKFEAAVSLLSKRWVGLIWEVLLAGPCRFSQIQTRVPAMSDRMLALRLKEMERAGIVSRSVMATAPVQVVYQLTPKGQDFEAVLTAIHRWADQWSLFMAPEGTDPCPLGPDSKTTNDSI